jgi:uncharacterized protein (DUF362 family)
MVGKNRQSRREFLYNMSTLTVSTLLFGSCSDDSSGVDPTNDPDVVRPARVGKPNPYVNQSGQPLLLCVEGNNYETMLQAGLDRLGGLNQILGNNESVLIKPNCNSVDSYPGISRVDSITALIAAASQVTSGTIRVGDQGYDSSIEVYPHMGLQDAVTQAGGELLTFSGDIIYVRQSHWDESLENVRVYTQVYNAPAIFNLCNLKRHRWAAMTSAIKNNIGAITRAGARGSREYLHSLEGDEFKQWVAEIAALISPELNVVDARQVLTVDGPFSAWGQPVVANKLILCGDMVATDAYGAQLMASLDDTFSVDSFSPTLTRAEELGLGTADLSQVEVVEISV